MTKKSGSCCSDRSAVAEVVVTVGADVIASTVTAAPPAESADSRADGEERMPVARLVAIEAAAASPAATRISVRIETEAAT